jgi:polysaccharide pyruvyl transferase WcaK-like protein
MLNPPVRIFLYGYYGANNIGDDLLLSAVIRNLSSSSTQVEFLVKCLNKPSHISQDNVKFIQIEKIMIDTRQTKLARLIRYGYHAWQSLAGCDLFVFGGGTLFHAKNKSFTNLLLIFMWTAFAKLRGAKVYAIGVGILPLRGAIAKEIFRMVVNICSDFAVRDITSLQQCDRKLIARDKVRLTADLIFSEPAAPIVKETDRLVLALTLAASDLNVFDKGRSDLFQEFAQALSTLSEQGWTVRLLAFQESDKVSKFSDGALFDQLEMHCPNVTLERVMIRPNWAEIMGAYKDLTVVTGMRFHGHVIAALSGIPFIGLSDDHKVSDLCKTLDMPSLGLENFTAGQLIEAVALAKARRVDREKLYTLAQLANNNYSRIRDAIKCV